jgi:hypothetical protein
MTMKELAVVFILFLFFNISCNNNRIDKKLVGNRAKIDSLKKVGNKMWFDFSRRQAYYELKNNHLILYSREDSEKKYYVLNRDYGIIGLYNFNLGKYHNDIVDSVLFARFGRDIYEKSELKAEFIGDEESNFYSYLNFYYKGEHVIDSLLEIELRNIDKSKIDTSLLNDVVVEFCINPKGKLYNIKVLKGVTGETDSIIMSFYRKHNNHWLPAYNEKREILKVTRVRKTIHVTNPRLEERIEQLERQIKDLAYPSPVIIIKE